MKGQKLDSIQKSLLSGQLTLSQLVEYYLDQSILAKNHNAFIEIFQHEALERALFLDQKRQQNPESIGKLHGMVISIKDNIAYKGHQLTASSEILKGHTAMYTATALQRALDEDVIVIGRTNCDEFGMGSTNEFSAYGHVKNGLNPARVPGGSSGGAAVSVQLDACLAALGSDTGGSIRQPAAFCGLLGIKPTYGKVSRYGLIAYGSSFDQIGIICKHASDGAQLLSVIEGADPKDATSSQKPAESYHVGLNSKYRIGYLKEAFSDAQLAKEIKEAFRWSQKKLTDEGHYLDSCSISLMDYLVSCYYVLTTAEASSNLGRYDGIRFGKNELDADSLEEMYRKVRTSGFGPEVKRRIALGTFVLSEGYYDAYYLQAQKVRRMIKKEINDLFNSFDLICLPVTAQLPWKLGEMPDDPIAMYYSDIFTVLANICGIPAVSIPIQLNDKSWPVGIQLLAPPHQENRLFDLANRIFSWHNN
jgi:aspartyl-tRNA(Asn)/glutamyl-tRNA(Gln) amidotransferase subunit A